MSLIVQLVTVGLTLKQAFGAAMFAEATWAAAIEEVDVEQPDEDRPRLFAASAIFGSWHLRINDNAIVTVSPTRNGDLVSAPISKKVFYLGDTEISDASDPKIKRYGEFEIFVPLTSINIKISKAC